MFFLLFILSVQLQRSLSFPSPKPHRATRCEQHIDCVQLLHPQAAISQADTSPGLKAPAAIQATQGWFPAQPLNAISPRCITCASKCLSGFQPRWIPQLFLPRPNTSCSSVILPILMALCLPGLDASHYVFMYMLYPSCSPRPSASHYSSFILLWSNCLCHEALFQCTHSVPGLCGRLRFLH